MPQFPLLVDAMPLAACVALFWATFLQEGVALAAGAVLIVNGDAPPILVALSLFAGIVCGDCCVYGLGALARQSSWARRMISGVDLKKAEAWLAKHMLTVVATCHVVPWLLFPTFVAYGWFKVPFKRFALTSLGFSAVYTPLALLALTRIGSVALPYFSERTWLLWLPAAFVLMLMIAFRLRRSPS